MKFCRQKGRLLLSRYETHPPIFGDVEEHDFAENHTHTRDVCRAQTYTTRAAVCMMICLQALVIDPNQKFRIKKFLFSVLGEGRGKPPTRTTFILRSARGFTPSTPLTFFLTSTSNFGESARANILRKESRIEEAPSPLIRLLSVGSAVY